MVGPWVADSIRLYRVLRTGIQYIGNWASRVGTSMFHGNPHVDSCEPCRHPTSTSPSKRDPRLP